MLQLESIEGAYSFHSYDSHSARLIKPDHNIHSKAAETDDFITISSTTLIYKEQLETEQLPANFSEFDEQCVQQLCQYDAEIFLIGTGMHSQFPARTVLQYIAHHKLAIDFMDLGAASRTFNILSSEYRKVAALIFFS